MNEAIHYLQNYATEPANLRWYDFATFSQTAGPTQDRRDERHLQCHQQAVPKKEAGRPRSTLPPSQEQHGWGEDYAALDHGIRLYDSTSARAGDETFCLMMKPRWVGIKGLDGEM